MKRIPMRPAVRRGRATAAVIATAGLALLAAACGGPASARPPNGPGGAPSAVGSAASSPLLAFSRCVRSHGVPAFPDPQPDAGNAKFPSAQQLGVSSSQYVAAENACQHLLPDGVDDQFPEGEVPLLLPGMRQFSQCMRSRGVPNWPDPSIDSEGRPLFLLSAHGITRSQAHSSQIMATEQECQQLLPSALGGIPAG